MNDLEILKSKMEIGNIERGLILNNEKASKVNLIEFSLSEGRQDFLSRGRVAQSVERPKGPSLVQLYWRTWVRFPVEA